MAKIPFSIKYRPQIESGEYKVETRDGRTVRIVCWDAKGLCPIIYLLRPTGFGGDSIENPCHCTNEGNYCNRAGCQDEDLFIITPEPELTEFEKAFLERVFHQKAEDLDEENREIFREDARCVLELARKQLRQEIRAEALKARWSKAAGYSFVGKSIMCDEHGFYSADITKPGCRYITCDILAKLPGFNE